MLLPPTLPEYITFGAPCSKIMRMLTHLALPAYTRRLRFMVSNPSEDYDDDTESTMSDVRSGSPAPSLYSFTSSVDERFIVSVTL